MAERGKNKEKKITINGIVNSAIDGGIGVIVQNHPRLTNQEKFITNYLDKKKINDYVRDYMTHNVGRGKSLDIKDLTEKFTGYVASGEFLDEKGKELVLRTSLQEDSKRLFRGRGAREILRGEKYLDDTMASFKDLYNLFKTGDYSKRMPKLAEAVTEVYNMGFADAAVNVLYENGLMDKSKYRVFKRAINERVKGGVKYTQTALEDYIIPQKAAAVVLAGIGIGALITNNSITGNVIGISNPNLFGLLGGILLVISGIFLWFKKK